MSEINFYILSVKSFCWFPVAVPPKAHLGPWRPCPPHVTLLSGRSQQHAIRRSQHAGRSEQAAGRMVNSNHACVRALEFILPRSTKWNCWKLHCDISVIAEKVEICLTRWGLRRRIRAGTRFGGALRQNIFKITAFEKIVANLI